MIYHFYLPYDFLPKLNFERLQCKELADPQDLCPTGLNLGSYDADKVEDFGDTENAFCMADQCAASQVDAQA